MLSESTLRRLGFIRYLYWHGIEQSRKPEPMCAVSILTFHDSIELFLQLAVEHKNAAPAKRIITFMGYWDLLKDKMTPNGLSQKVSMDRLNNSRVSLKHHGTLPSRLDIDSFRASTESFFQENTPAVFGITFDSISMANLVACDEVKRHLEKATELMGTGDADGASEHLALAFIELLDDYTERNREILGWTSLFHGFSRLHLHGWEGGLDSELRDLTGGIEELQKAVRILGLGLDYQHYVKFRQLTPIALRAANGGIIIQRTTGYKTPSRTQFEFCHDFVITAAIQLQQVESEAEANQ